MFNDKDFIEFLEDKEFIEDFMLLSSTFTILDPFGYFYAQIFDHYIEKYSEIQHNISEILLNWPNINLIQKKLTVRKGLVIDVVNHTVLKDRLIWGNIKDMITNQTPLNNITMMLLDYGRYLLSTQVRII